MCEEVVYKEIHDKEQLQEMAAGKVQFCFFGEDGVWFRAFSLCGGAAVCYVVTMDAPKQEVDEKKKEIFAACEWKEYYLGMGHSVRMRQHYYPDFFCQVAEADYRYPAAFKAVKHLLAHGIDKQRYRNIVKGVVYGHAIGDALGVPAEFLSREALKRKPMTEQFRRHPTLRLPRGCWSDDTSMSLCALASLAKGKVDFNDVMRNFLSWYNEGEFTPTGYVFDAGLICAKAIERYEKGVAPTACGGTDERDNGNGSLMRIYPFVLYLFDKEIPFAKKMEIIHQASALTHAHRRSQIACGIYACALWGVMTERSAEGCLSGLVQALSFYRGEEELDHFLFLDNFLEKTEEQIKSTGYVVDTLEAALWCFFKSKDYASCVLSAVNLGGDADTVAAVAGSLAGALYGYDAINPFWMQSIVNEQVIEATCCVFLEGVTCYGVEDVTAVKAIQLHRTTPFCRHAWYELTLTIDGEDCDAIYSANDTENLQLKGGDKVPLTAQLAEKLRALTGESDEQRATRRLLGLDNFLYGYADWTYRLSKAQTEARLQDFAKVSLSAFRGLPKHWLDLLPASAMYDWLHCSGYAGTREAYEFVDTLVAQKNKPLR